MVITPRKYSISHNEIEILADGVTSGSGIGITSVISHVALGKVLYYCLSIAITPKVFCIEINVRDGLNTTLWEFQVVVKFLKAHVKRIVKKLKMNVTNQLL